MRNVLPVLAVALMSATSVESLAAQVIIGVVTDAKNGQALADASIVLLNDKGQIKRGTLTELDGTYVLQCPEAGTFVVRSGGAGYPSWNSAPIEVGRGDTVELMIRLMPEGETIGLADFDRRRAQDKGLFLTEEEIRERGGNRFTDVFLGLAGVSVVPLSFDARRDIPERGQLERNRGRSGRPSNTVRLAASHGRAEAGGARHAGERAADCPPVLYVDGRWWGRIDDIGDDGPDYYIDPDDLIGIEIFTKGVVPRELDTGRDSDCGVIVVWTKKARQ